MSSSRRARVIVVGAGIVGCSVASHLAVRGADVVLIDAHRGPNRAASRWSYAWFNSNHKEPDWYHHLNVRGMNEYPRLAQTLSDRSWYFPVGHLMWADEPSPLAPGGTSSPTDRRHLERLARLGYRFQRLSASDVTELEPGIAPAAIPDQTLLFPDEGWIDTARLTESLLRWGASRGSIECRWNTTISRFDVGSDRIRSITTDAHERLTADIFVTCAGANTAPLLRLLGVEIGIAPRSAVVAISNETAATLHRVLHAGAISVRPHPGRRLMLHRNIGDDTVQAGPTGHEVPTQAIQQLIDGARACLTVDDLELDQLGLIDMPMPADGHPAVGWLTAWTNLYLAVTHSAATIGPLLGRIVAEHIDSGTRDAALESCSPDRLLNSENSTGVSP